MQQNPLLVTIHDLIDYQSITPEHIKNAIPKLIDNSKQAVENAALIDSVTWDNFIEPLQDSFETLWRAWSISGHLNNVVNTPELRDAFNHCLPLVSEFSTWVGLHQGLYQQYKNLKNNDEFASLSKTRQRIIDLALKDFRLNGADLIGDDRKIYSEISEEQAITGQKFSENTLDSVDSWALYIDDETLLEGIPDEVKAAAKLAAQEDKKQGWKLNLQMPCYIPVMQYAKNRQLRHDMYKAYATIASEQFNDTSFDNSKLIEKLLELRAQEAKLLGFNNYAELKLQTRMAENSGQVAEFLQNLATKSKPFAENDLKQLQEFAKENLGIDELEPWDVAFASENLRVNKYDYSENEIKQYFTEPQVVKGLFQVIKTLYNVDFKAVDLSVWHQDVRSYQAIDANNNVIGILYMDLFARNGKQSGAWVSSERDRRLTKDKLQKPIVYLTCNFTPAAQGKPSLLTHNDVITLFHESGHALHALLSKVDDPGASAFSAVEWDAIELPSQFMENFCWEWSVIKSMTKHVDSNEHLPMDLYKKIIAAKNFQSGMLMVRQLEFALFDMLIHEQNQGLSIEQVLKCLDDVRAQVAVIIPPSWHRFPHNFSHLFAGGYSAGYYSYKWAEVLSADVYSAFEEKAITLPDGSRDTLIESIGKKFLDEVLSVGGIRPSIESFKKFRGREPKIDALLKHSGMLQ